MVDRVDLLIAVIGIVVSIVGSSTALWIGLSKKADKDDLARLESRLEARIAGLEHRFDTRIDGIDGSFGRLESKLDALILRLVPQQLPHPEN